MSDGARPRKTGEAVATTLRRQIASGDLVSGDRLPPEDELMEHFGVARTTLREGLRILESQGLIEIRRGRKGGPRITAPPIERLAQGFALHLQLANTTIGDLDDARELIEPAMAAELARNHTTDDLEALAKAIEVAEEAASSNDLRAFGEAAALVHTTITDRSKNTTLVMIARLLHELVEHYYLYAATKADAVQTHRAVRSYKKLLRLVEAGDAERAADHWRKQMTYTISAADRNKPLDLFRTDP